MKGEKDEAAASTVTQILSVIVVVPLILIFGQNFAFQGLGNSSQEFVPWIAILAAAAFTVVFTFLSFRASKEVEASERAIVSRVNIFWALLFASVFLSETVSLQKIGAVILIFAASSISIYRPGVTKLKIEGLQLVVIASAFSAAIGISSKFGVGLMPPLVFALAKAAVVAFGLYLLIGKNAIARCAAIWKRKPAGLLVNGIACAVFDISVIVAYALLPASVVIPVLSTAVVLTAIAGGILLGEKEGWLQKIVGAVLAVIGAMLISGA